MTTNGERTLWLTLRGAAPTLPLAWLAWCALVLAVAWTLAGTLGPAGAMIAVLAAGWVVARRAPSPREAFRFYHLDDDELVAMGPGRQVRRLPWSAVTTLTQERRALRIEGEGVSIRLPLHRLVEADAWGAVLARVVPALADEMWALLEEGEQVELTPSLEPATRLLAWWAYAPALLACLAGTGLTGLRVGFALAAAERCIALVRSHGRTVALHRAGAALRVRLWRFLVAWTRVEVVRVPSGLLLATHGRRCGVVASELPNFWAAAGVIAMKAHLGPRTDALVHFRVRMAEDGPAVVGEVESG
jgi:hypothetical protein